MSDKDTAIEIRIRDFPDEGQPMTNATRLAVCEGIARRVRSEYPAAMVSVFPDLTLAMPFTTRMSSPDPFVWKDVQFHLSDMVTDSLENVAKGERERHSKKPTQLEAERKQMEVALRSLVLATTGLLITGAKANIEQARVAVAEAMAVLGGSKPKFVGGGELSFPEMAMALKNIGFDLTCGQCASRFYTGSGTNNFDHDATCHTTMCPQH